MFSHFRNHQDVDILVHDLKDKAFTSGEIDAIVENYISLVNRLKEDIHALKQELDYHKKLHGDLSYSLDEFLTIQKASEIITRHLEYDKIVASLLKLCTRIIRYEAGNVVLKEGDRWIVVLPEHRDDFLKLSEAMLEEGILEWMWEHQQSIVVPLHEFIIHKALSLKEGNLVITPLVINDNHIGMLLLFTRKEQSQFSLRDLELINLLGMQTAIAIQYTRLFKDLERAHTELKQSQAQLMQAVKLATVGELAGGIAHEINNPLQIILGKIQVAMMGNHSQDTLKIVEMQALRIATIVRGLLMLARENKQQASDLVEINPLIVNTLKLVRGQIEKRGIEIELKLAEKLPVITANAIYLQQILLNFFLTAKKQLSRGGKLTIQTRMAADDFIEIRIHDTGDPLDANDVANALVPFSVTSGTQHNLSLMVSVQMIRDIGGEVDIQSSPDAGNTVMIRIKKNVQFQSGRDDGALASMA